MTTSSEICSPTLNRRYLKCFACGIAHKFSCSANHYAWLARHYGISRITIDLLNLTIEPVEFDIPRNQILAGMCRDNLLHNVRDLKPPASVVSAVLIADFDIQDYGVGQSGFEYIGESTFTVLLTDDQEKCWRGERTLDQVLADGDGFGDPNR